MLKSHFTLFSINQPLKLMILYCFMWCVHTTSAASMYMYVCFIIAEFVYAYMCVCSVQTNNNTTTAAQKVYVHMIVWPIHKTKFINLTKVFKLQFTLSASVTSKRKHTKPKTRRDRPLFAPLYFSNGQIPYHPPLISI